MARGPRGYIVSGAVISGWPAHALSRLLTRHCRDAIEDLPPDLREPVEETIEALRLAAAAWAATSASGSAEVPLPEPLVSSSYEPDEISTGEAAQQLGISARRIRQLCEQGALPARRVGARWLVDRGAVRNRSLQLDEGG